MIPVEPSALSQRDVLSSSSTATSNPSVDLADGPAQRAVEVDLGRGQRPGAELVLEPADGEAVGVDPSSVRGTSEATRAPGCRRPPRRARAVTAKRSASATEQNHFSPVMRHAPARRGRARRAALAPTSDPPWTSVRNCDPRRHGVVVGVVQPGEEARAQLGLAPVLDGADGPGRAHDRAGVAALAGVGEQVEERGQLEGARARPGRRRAAPTPTARPASS